MPQYDYNSQECFDYSIDQVISMEGEGEMTEEQRMLTNQLPTAQTSYEEVRRASIVATGKLDTICEDEQGSTSPQQEFPQPPQTQQISNRFANSTLPSTNPVSPRKFLEVTKHANFPFESPPSSYEARPRYSTPVTRPLGTVRNGANSVVTKSSCTKKPQTVIYNTSSSSGLNRASYGTHPSLSAPGRISDINRSSAMGVRSGSNTMDAHRPSQPSYRPSYTSHTNTSMNGNPSNARSSSALKSTTPATTSTTPATTTTTPATTSIDPRMSANVHNPSNRPMTNPIASRLSVPVTNVGRTMMSTTLGRASLHEGRDRSSEIMQARKSVSVNRMSTGDSYLQQEIDQLRKENTKLRDTISKLTDEKGKLEIRVKELSAQIKEYNKMPYRSRSYYVCFPIQQSK